MAIPSRQIGWGTQENLLWEISKQLEQLAGVMSKIGQTTSTTTTNSPTTTTTTTSTPITKQATLIYESISGGSGYPKGFDNGQQCSASVMSNPFITVYFSTPLIIGTAFFSDISLTTPIQIETSDGYFHYKLTWVDGMTVNNFDVSFNGGQFTNKTVNSIISC
jgi:hypothetical protein